MNIPITNTSNNELPEYMSEHAAGVDVRASLGKKITLQPGEYRAIPTGVSVAVPVGYELQVRARSGLANKHGIGCVNGIGTIDAEYRGEVFVLLINHGKEPFEVNDGDRIAQFVGAAHEKVSWQQVDSLTDTNRGSGGLGSTGSA